MNWNGRSNDFHFCASTVIAMAMAVVNCGFSQTHPITALCVAPDGKLLIGSDHGLQVIDPVTMKPIGHKQMQIEKIYSIKISPDGKRMAIAGGSPAELGIVEIWSLPDYKSTHRFARFDDVATDVGWRSNDQLVACSMSGNCCNIQLDQTKPDPFNVHSKGILALDVLSDDQITTAGIDTSIRVWAWNDSKGARLLNNHVGVVNDIARRPNPDSARPEMIATVSDDATIRFWQPTIGRMVRFVRLESPPTCVVWNHDGSLAIAGCQDGAIRIVDPGKAVVIRTIQGTGWIDCIAISPDGKHFFVGGQAGLTRVAISQ